MDTSDISVEAEVELGGVEDLDRFLKEREDALDQVSSGIKEDARLTRIEIYLRKVYRAMISINAWRNFKI